MIKYLITTFVKYELNYDVKPRNWNDLLAKLALLISKDVKLREVPKLRTNGIIFSWNPTLVFYYAVNRLIGNKLFFLCWGLPSVSQNRLLRYLKIRRLCLVTRLSSISFVNERATQIDLQKYCNVDSTIIPYSVDTEFYTYSRIGKLTNKILVVGDNGRDEEIVLALANRGYQVTRVTRSIQVVKYYEVNSHINVTICYRVSYVELRKQYYSNDLLLLPIAHTNHAAGQTAILEAISCGCPVVLNNVRIASIVSGYSSVFIVDNNVVESYVTAIIEARKLFERPEILLDSSRRIHEIHSIQKVSEVLYNKILEKVQYG